MQGSFVRRNDTKANERCPILKKSFSEHIEDVFRLLNKIKRYAKTRCGFHVVSWLGTKNRLHKVAHCRIQRNCTQCISHH